MGYIHKSENKSNYNLVWFEEIDISNEKRSNAP